MMGEMSQTIPNLQIHFVAASAASFIGYGAQAMGQLLFILGGFSDMRSGPGHQVKSPFTFFDHRSQHLIGHVLLVGLVLGYLVGCLVVPALDCVTVMHYRVLLAPCDLGDPFVPELDPEIIDRKLEPARLVKSPMG
jgi:hypothetical protein